MHHTWRLVLYADARTRSSFALPHNLHLFFFALLHFCTSKTRVPCMPCLLHAFAVCTISTRLKQQSDSPSALNCFPCPISFRHSSHLDAPVCFNFRLIVLIDSFSLIASKLETSRFPFCEKNHSHLFSLSTLDTV